ncbi:MAG: hypothetical protein K2W85_14385 [Phycisphaerales bacterium]|nr:hypothetical protein [Phycisphaerales bacterium]
MEKKTKTIAAIALLAILAAIAMYMWVGGESSRVDSQTLDNAAAIVNDAAQADPSITAPPPVEPEAPVPGKLRN